MVGMSFDGASSMKSLTTKKMLQGKRYMCIVSPIAMSFVFKDAIALSPMIADAQDLFALVGVSLKPIVLFEGI